MINESTYCKIKSILKTSISLYDVYQFADLFHDTIMILLEYNKTNEENIKLCKRIATNLVINQYRKCKKINRVKLIDIYPASEIKESSIIIKPIKYKEMFILRYRFKMKLREIAVFKGININTIKQHSIRMKEELKTLNHERIF